MLRHCLLTVAVSAGSFSLAIGQSMSPQSDSPIRVRVTVNADGSRTAYRFDDAKHEAVATTTDEEGGARGKVVYQTDDAGRFISGVVFGPDGKFVFKTLYKYGDGGRLEEETHLNQQGGVINKVLYKYDSRGKEIGYSIFDANGKLTAGTATATPTPGANKDRKGSRR